MCLAVPVQVKEVREDHTALADLGGLEMEIRTDLVPEVCAGQYVIVHAGFAISVMDVEEAEETIRMLEEIYASEILSEG